MEGRETFIGILGSNPELKYTLKQQAVCQLAVAVSSDDSNLVEWKRVTVWGKAAETCSVQMKKGSHVFVQGQKRVREYINKDGEKKNIEEISAQYVGLAFN